MKPLHQIDPIITREDFRIVNSWFKAEDQSNGARKTIIIPTSPRLPIKLKNLFYSFKAEGLIEAIVNEKRGGTPYSFQIRRLPLFIKACESLVIKTVSHGDEQIFFNSIK